MIKSMIEFKTEINKKIIDLRNKNIENLNLGDMWKYHANCNELKGINFVMEKLKTKGLI